MQMVLTQAQETENLIQMQEGVGGLAEQSDSPSKMTEWSMDVDSRVHLWDEKEEDTEIQSSEAVQNQDETMELEDSLLRGSPPLQQEEEDMPASSDKTEDPDQVVIETQDDNF